MGIDPGEHLQDERRIASRPILHDGIVECSSHGRKMPRSDVAFQRGGDNRRVTATQDRFRGLVDAGIALSSELSLDALLQKLVDAAAELTGARYAALGVIDQARTGLERFVTAGVDDETRRRIGDLPRGRGILGVLVRDATPLRLHDIADDPRSVGFPPGHPPMRSFLGVPVLQRNVAYGNLYLS